MYVWDKHITDLIPSKTLENLSAQYKTQALKTNRLPQLWKLFKENRITRNNFDLVVGVVGGIKPLHEYMGKQIPVQKDNFEDLLQKTILEAKSRISKMTNVEIINLFTALSKLINNPNGAQINTQIIVDIDEALAKRL